MWCLSLYCSYPASYSNCSIFGWWKLDCLLIHFDITVVFFASFLVFWYYRMFHTQQKLFWGTLGKLCALFWILGCIFWNCYFIKYLAAWKNPYNDFMMLIFFFGNKEYLKKYGIRKESKWFITTLVWNAASSLRFVPPTAALQPSNGSRNIWIKTGSFLGSWQSSTFVTLCLHEARYCWFGLCDTFEPWFPVVLLGPGEVSRALAAYFSCLFGSSS